MLGVGLAARPFFRTLAFIRPFFSIFVRHFITVASFILCMDIYFTFIHKQYNKVRDCGLTSYGTKHKTQPETGESLNSNLTNNNSNQTNSQLVMSDEEEHLSEELNRMDVAGEGEGDEGKFHFFSYNTNNNLSSYWAIRFICLSERKNYRKRTSCRPKKFNKICVESHTMSSFVRRAPNLINKETSNTYLPTDITEEAEVELLGDEKEEGREDEEENPATPPYTEESATGVATPPPPANPTDPPLQPPTHTQTTTTHPNQPPPNQPGIVQPTASKRSVKLASKTAKEVEAYRAAERDRKARQRRRKREEVRTLRSNFKGSATSPFSDASASPSGPSTSSASASTEPARGENESGEGAGVGNGPVSDNTETGSRPLTPAPEPVSDNTETGSRNSPATPNRGDFSQRGRRGSFRSHPYRPPTNTPRNTNPTTPRTQLRNPSQVYPEDSRITLRITREGDGAGTAEGLITRELFLLEGEYSLFNMRPIQGGVTANTSTPESERVITDYLRERGWEVVATPLWARYHFAAPTLLRTLPTEDIVRGLILRNRPGLLPGSLRYVSSRTDGGAGGSEPQRLRIWVDVSPEAETYLRDHDFLLRTVAAAVRLRPAASNRRHSDRS